MSKPVVFVIGASGNVGKATVNALSSSYGGKLDVKAGVRDPAKDSALQLQSLAGVTVVQAEMGQKEKLAEKLKGVDALFIVCPGTENKAQLSITTAEAAKEAGVKFVLVVSVDTADLPHTIFGKQFNEIETAVSGLGVPCAFLRLPLFMDNYFAYQTPIKSSSVFYGPVDPSKPYTPVAVDDAGVAAAAILASPEKHAGKTYTIVSDRHTFEDVAKAFTGALGREVKFIRVPYEDARAAFVQMGFQEWQIDGVMELYRLIDAGSPITNRENTDDFLELTGKKPTPLSQWVTRVATAFK